MGRQPRLRPDGSNPFTKRLRPRKVKGVDVTQSFTYWARRAGWDKRDIDARTGHGSKEMAERYDRGARAQKEPQLHTRLHR